MRTYLKLHQYEQVERRPIIYMDESGFSVDAPRERGYSSIATRCCGCKNLHSRGRVNAIGAIHHFKMLNIYLFEGNINADIFHAWTADRLIPSLPESSVIVMDNAAFHQRADTLKAIRTKGYDVLFVPTYSPDLNPIEKKWAQAKNIRKKRKCKPYQLFETFLV
ncbi:MAG: transposase [Cytophagaceae bacterium]|jgi:transposase|nr:transposase [Cytophagaceae bacterium]